MLSAPQIFHVTVLEGIEMYSGALRKELLPDSLIFE